MQRLLPLLALLLVVTGCASPSRETRPVKTAPVDAAPAQASAPCRAGTGKSAGEVVPYLKNRISQVSIFVPCGGVSDGADVTDATVLQPLQAALSGAAVIEATEFTRRPPDVSMVLWTDSPAAKWGMTWISGSDTFRLEHDGQEGKPLTLQVSRACLAVIAQAVNKALAGQCPVSPVAHPSADLGLGRSVPPFLMVDGGGVWKAGEISKVVWRISGPDAEQPPLLKIRRSDGKNGGDIQLEGPATTYPGHDFGGNVTIPEPGCWTITATSGTSSAAVTIRVR